MRKTRKPSFSIFTTRPLQLRFTSMILIYSFLIFAFLAVSLFLSDVYQMQNESLSIEIRASIAERVISIHALVWPTFLGILFLIGVHFFLNFQRLTRPLAHFHQAFEEAGKGDLLARVKLLERDYLHSEEESLNRMLQNIAGRLEEIKKEGVMAERSLFELEQAIGRTESCRDATSGMLQEHGTHLKNLMEALHYFKTTELEERYRNANDLITKGETRSPSSHDTV